MSDTSTTTTSLLVIGAGLPRTGTKSMKQALEILYSKPCYHMVEIVTKKHDDIEKWQKLFDEAFQTIPNESVIRRGLMEILNGYGAVTDVPACGFYQELMNIYPDAKVVLTIRDKYDWLSSVRHSVMPKSNDPQKQTFDDAKQALSFGQEAEKMIMSSLKQTFHKYDLNIDDDQFLLTCFDEYNKRVQETVPPERLLIHKFGDGWEPLCKFLNMDIPNGVVYPHVNSRSQVNELFDLIKTHAPSEKLAEIFPEFHGTKFEN
ncbi:unnamed protein product [Schistosoma turkestanicum]|nr:unnamed protein product [Schistosoma turkestanicum]